MSTIISKAQNLPENIDLLVAQRRLYSDAKRARGFRTVGSLIAAIPLPILGVMVSSSQSLVTVMGGLWLLAALVLMLVFVRGKTSDGTRVLEEFDVRVFSLPWNERIAGKRVISELVTNAMRRSRVDHSQLRDWYPPIVGEVPWPLSVLVCQRAAVVWDWRLRRAYGWLILVSTLGLFFASVLVALLMQYTVAQWLLVLALPMASAFTGGTQTAFSNLGDAAQQSEMHDRLDEDWRRALREHISLTSEESRQHQDCRFMHRLVASPIPDWWYRALRGRYETDMAVTAERMVREFKECSD